ncbi:unnamed protein product [Paramecium sonneborni]|uniref:NACHT domain-containing protein n=1 Tax=Paramecium sonneborni TaxID=65129 RepID=A0A8S1QDZ7_9CILI|nr:unnamed protein product [Paramecium sonneborni]
MTDTFLKENYQISETQIEQKLISKLMMVKNEKNDLPFSKFDCNYNIHDQKHRINYLVILRGGGCGKSKQQKNINSQQQKDENLINSVQIPKDYLTNLNNCLKLIIEEAKFIGDITKRNQVIKKILWFIHNREYLNNYCIDQKEGSQIYDSVSENFEKLLEALIIYLRNSGIICYQVLIICNELLKIMYSFQLGNSLRFLEEEKKQEYLSKLSEFDTQLEIESANVWKTGIEFEIKIMKIMIMNSQTDSTEGTDLLINFFKEAGKSIVSLSPSEDLLQTILDGGKYLLQKGIEKKLYPQETYQTYYLFQLIKWSIIKQLKSQYSVYKQIQQLKDIFSQYILVSDNWILHFCWIQMITDIIGYRPIVDKSNLEKQWKYLIENNLIQCVSYNKNEAIMNLFNKENQINEVEFTRILDIYGKKKFALFSQFLMKGDLTLNVNLWDYYKEFTFKKQQNKIQQEFETILRSQELEVLQKLINNFKFAKDEIISIHEGIIQLFLIYFKEPSQIQLQIFQDDQVASQKQFLETYKRLIILIIKIQELSNFEVQKLNMLQPYLDKFKKQDNLAKIQELKLKIDNFLDTELQNFIILLLDYFLIAIKFASVIYTNSLFIEKRNQMDLEKITQLLEINTFQRTILNFEAHFDQFSINLNSFKQNFLKFILEEKEILSTIILVQDQNILDIIEFNCKGELINKIIQKLQSENYINNFKLYDSKMETLDDAIQNLIDCKFSIILLQFLKQFSNIQFQQVQIIYQQLKSYTQNHNQQKIETGEEMYLQTIAAILIQQQLKISQLTNQNVNESDIQSFQLQCKSILVQIKSDFIFIKKECNKLQNNFITREILEFLAEVQFRILQILNQTEDRSNLFQLLKEYEQKYDKLKEQEKSYAQNHKQTQDFEEISENFQSQHLRNKDKFLTDIKETKKYYKQYENLLILQIDLLQQNVNREQENRLQQLNMRRNNFFSEKVKAQIRQLIDGFLELNQLKQIDIFLKLPDFLSFYYSLSNNEYLHGLKGDKINDSILQEIKNAYKDNKEKLLDSIDLKPDHKVREGLVYNLIKLQQSIQEQQINSFSTKQIQYMWVFEKDQRVRNLLKNKELIEIQKQLFSQDQDNLSNSIQDELKQRMERLENLQQQIKLEGNQQKREQLQTQLKLNYDELDISLDNISEMSETMNISLLFLRDISKDIKSMKNSIDNLQQSLNQVGDDIRKLRGKSYKELLDIRKEKILLQSKIAEVDSVYVQLMTIEYDPVSGQSIKTNDNIETSFLMADRWDDFTGEINEFIWCQLKQKDVMLLSGYAGSGKSKAARKIEEFLWKQQNHQIKWIPIFVSLPTIQNPKYNLFEQALESENYQFDKYQIREFKEAIQSKKEYIILILDSYDEMKQDFIQQNLIMTNKLFQDLSIDKLTSQMKVIITTRKEILNTVGYQIWFYGDSLQTLKEVQLQNFNEDQQRQYLYQYVELSVKRKIKAIYEFVKQISGQNFDLVEFLDIWSLISQQIKNCIQKSENQGQDGIFQNKEEEIIIGKIKTHKILQILTDEQATGLKKELLGLWSANKFIQSIESVKIEDLLKTPFMLEIVVQVLPNMTSKYSGSTAIKKDFIINLLKLRKQFRLSQNAREKYKKQILLFQNQQQTSMVNLDEEQIPEEEQDEENQSKIDRAKIDEIIDSLDNQKFFQNYSIVSRLKQNRDSIIFDGYTIRLNPDDLNIVLMALKMKKFTVFEFYESFINFYHEQQIQKQRELGKISNYESFIFDVNQFSCSLAIDMTLKDLSQIGYKPQGKLDLKSNYKIQQVIDDWLKQYFDVEDEYKKLIRSCILLSAKGSTFSFTHKSIQEFYVAKYIFDLLISLNNIDQIIEQYNNENLEQNKDILLKSLFNQENFNISTDNYKGVINFVREKLINVENMNQKLIQIVKLSQFKNQNYCRASSNSIYLLNQMNVYLGSQDFKNIKLSNTNISGLSLFDSDLSFSQFKNVEINSCNFNLANLSNVNWSNVVCKEKPFLKDHTESVLEVKFSPNGQYIASIQEEKEDKEKKVYQIKLWSLKNFQLIKNLEQHTGKVNTLSFSQDFLFSGSNDETIIKWDIRNPDVEIKFEKIELFHKVKKVQISQDQKKLYVSGTDGTHDGTFQILDLQKNGKCEECIFIEKDRDYEKFAIHPIRQIVALLKIKGQLYFINYETKNQEELQHTQDLQNKEIMHLIFSYDGNLFVAASKNGYIVWNIAQDKITKQMVINFPNFTFSTLMFDQDNTKLIFGSDQQIFTRQIIFPQIKSHKNKEICFEIKISPLGRMIVVVYEKKLCFIDSILLQPVNTIIFDLQPNNIQFSKDGSKLSLFFNENQVIKQFQILDTFTLTVICKLPWKSSFWIKYLLSKDFEKLFILHQTCQPLNSYHFQSEFLRIIKINTKKIHKDVENRKFNLKVTKFCAKANSWIIAFQQKDENFITIFDLDKYSRIQQPISNEQQDVYDFQFSPCANQLAVLYNIEIVIWNLDSNPFIIQGRLSLYDKMLESMKYCPDGQQIGLVFQDRTFQIYDLKNNNLQKAIENNQIKGQIEFSLDNNMIGFQQDFNIVILSKNKNFEQIVLEGDSININQIIFTQDSQSLISGCSGELILWDLQTQKIKERKKTSLKGQAAITFSHNRNFILLSQSCFLELWKYSQNSLIFIGSQVLDINIKYCSFINYDRNILFLQEDQELIIQDLDCFQFEQIFPQFFQLGAISSDYSIALQNDFQLKIFSNEFDEEKFSEKFKFLVMHLEFFEHKQNLLLILASYYIIKIWDYKEKLLIFEIDANQSYQEISLQLYSSDQLLILQYQEKKNIVIWNLKNFETVHQIGLHENINCFSIQENGERAVGIKNNEAIIIQDILNIKFTFPQQQEISIQKLFMSFEKQYFIILCCSQKNQNHLLLLQIDKNQIFPFKENVKSIDFCQEKNQIAVQTESKIELVFFSENTFKTIDTYDLKNQTDIFDIQFINDGEGLLLKSTTMIKIFSIKNKQKTIFRFLYQILNNNNYYNLIKQAQLYFRHNQPSKQQFLAILNRESFQMLDIQKQKQIVILQNISHFLLSLDEKIICLVQTEEILSVYVSFLECENLNLKQIQHQIQFFSISTIGVLGRDSFAFIDQYKIKQNNEQMIEQITASTCSITEISVLQGPINHMIYLPKKEWLALSTYQNNIIFWDIKAKRKVGTLKGHQKTINFMSISQDEGILATASEDKLIKLWNIDQNESSEIKEAHSYEISAIAFSYDGKYFASASENEPIFYWDFIDKKFITQLKGDSNIKYLEFFYCSRYLVSGNKNGKIIVWNIQNPLAANIIQTINKYQNPLYSFSISPKDETLIALFSNYITKFSFDQIQEQMEKTINISANSKSHSFLQNNEFIYFDLTKKQLKILNFQTKKQQYILKCDSEIIQITTAKNGNIILYLNKDGNLFYMEKQKDNQWISRRLFCSKSTQASLSFDSQFLYQVNHITYTKSERLISLLFEDGDRFQTILHDFQKLKEFELNVIFEFSTLEAKNIFISSDLTLAAIAHIKNIEIYELKNKKYINKYLGCKCPEQLQISEDKKYITCIENIQQNGYNIYDNIIYLWEIYNPDNLTQLKIQDCELITYQMSLKDSNKIYAYYTDGNIREWNLTTKQNQIVKKLPDIIFDKNEIVLFSKNLEFLMYQNEKTKLHIIKLQGMEPQFIDVKEEFKLLALSQKKKIFAFAIKQKIKLFQEEKQQQISLSNYNQDDYSYYAQSICFSHDDQELVFCYDTNIYLYRIDDELQTQILGCWNVDGYFYQQIFCSSISYLEFSIITQNQIINIKIAPTILHFFSGYSNCQDKKFYCFSPDNKYLAISNSFVLLQELQNPLIIHKFKDCNADLVQFQSKEILVIAHQKELKFLNIANIDQIEYIQKFEFKESITGIVFTSKYSLITLNNSIRFDLIDQLQENQFQAIYNSNRIVVFSEKEDYFALSCPEEIQIINIEKLINLERCHQFDQGDGKIIYSSDGDLIYFCSQNKILIFDSKTFILLAHLDQNSDDIAGILESNPSFNNFEYNNQSKNFVFTTKSKVYQIRNLNEKFILQQVYDEKNQEIQCIALSPKGDLLLLGEKSEDSNSITLLKIEQVQNLSTNNSLNDEVNVIKFCPDGANFVAGLKDGSINLYSIFRKQANGLQNQKLESNYQIICYQSFAKQSLLCAFECILQGSEISSSWQSSEKQQQQSIKQLFLQKEGKN